MLNEGEHVWGRGYIFIICWMKGNVCEGGGYIISVVIFSFVYNASKFLEFETTYYQQVEFLIKLFFSKFWVNIESFLSDSWR